MKWKLSSLTRFYHILSKNMLCVKLSYFLNSHKKKNRKNITKLSIWFGKIKLIYLKKDQCQMFKDSLSAVD